MVSSSSLGATSITVQFTLERNIDAAAQDVQAAISKTLRQLPPGIVPPSLQKTNPADEPFLYLNLRSKSLPLSALDEYGQTVLGQRISTISGVAQVTVFGTQKYAARIQLVHRFAGGDVLLWSLDNFSGIETLQRVTEAGDVVWSMEENDQSKLTPLAYEENGESPEVFPLIREDRSKVVYYVAATGQACPVGANGQ